MPSAHETSSIPFEDGERQQSPELQMVSSLQARTESPFFMEIVMTKRRVIVELNYNKDLAEVAFSMAPPSEKVLDPGIAPKIAGVTFDTAFAPANLPGLKMRAAMDVPYI